MLVTGSWSWDPSMKEELLKVLVLEQKLRDKGIYQAFIWYASKNKLPLKTLCQ
jgi:hypothetical protein